MDKVPDSLVEFKMVRLPDSEKHKGLWIMETEVPNEMFDIWSLRLDMTQEQNAAGVDAQSRPSKPYAVIFTGFGHHGYPSICSSYLNAKMFAEWLGKKTGKKYRLPTVAEWQYAAKADGTKPASLDGAAWYWDNAEDFTHPIKKKKPNAWGLFDTLGNVGEWATNEKGEPGICGGSWKTKSEKLSAELFEPFDPMWNDADPQKPKSKWWLANGQFVGLRLVCED